MKYTTWVILPLVVASGSVIAHELENDPLAKLKGIWEGARGKAIEPIDLLYREGLAKLSIGYEAEGYSAGSEAVAAELELIKKLNDPNSVDYIDRTLTIVEAKYDSASSNLRKRRWM